jgi:hypothetical protein
MNEKTAEEIYRRVLDDIVYPLLGKKTTWAKDLNRIGLKLFGKNFTGAHASDTMPQLGINADGSETTNNNINKFSRLYQIANLDDSTMPGSHWIALAFDVDTKNVWVYDSFGRKTSKIMPNLVKQYGKKLMQVDDDAEQKLSEDDCGARAMAWLYVFDRYGAEVARLI